MKTFLVAVAALAVSACSAKDYDSAISLTSVLAGKATTTTSGTTTTTTCLVDPGAIETDFLRLGPDSVGHVGVVLQNKLASNQAGNPILRLDSNDFEAQTAKVDFEVLSGGGNLPGATRPASGLVPTGGKAAVGVILFDSGQLAAAGLADGTFFRANIQIEGKLHDASTVKSSPRSYLFQYCAGPVGCAGNPCL